MAKNAATDKELAKFATFIAEGLDMESLLANYELSIVNRLEKLSDKQLAEEKEFYDYKD